MCVWLFRVRIEMMRHEARGLPPDLPDLRHGAVSPWLLISGVWPFRNTGSEGRGSEGERN